MESIFSLAIIFSLISFLNSKRNGTDSVFSGMFFSFLLCSLFGVILLTASVFIQNTYLSDETNLVEDKGAVVLQKIDRENTKDGYIYTNDYFYKKDNPKGFEYSSGLDVQLTIYPGTPDYYFKTKKGTIVVNERHISVDSKPQKNVTLEWDNTYLKELKTPHKELFGYVIGVKKHSDPKNIFQRTDNLFLEVVGAFVKEKKEIKSYTIVYPEKDF